MKQTVIITGAARWALSFLLILGAEAQAGGDDRRLEQQMADYWAEYVEAYPLIAAGFGAQGPRDVLDDFGPEARAAQVKRLDDYIEALAKVRVNKLSPENREHFEAYNWMLRNERANLDHNSRFFAFNTLTGWHSGLVGLFLAQPYFNEEDYRDLLSRMSQVGRFADQNIALLEEGIAAGYTQPCDSLQGYDATISAYVADDPLKSAFIIPFARLPESIPAEVQAELRTEAATLIHKQINPAYKRYAAWFANTYMSACRKEAGLSSLPGGRAAYDQLLRYYTSLDTDADTVHALGLSEVERIQAEMREIIEEVAFDGDFAAFLEFLRSDEQFYKTNEQDYLNHVAWVAKSIDGKLPGYFSRLPSNPYGIKPIPAQTAPRTATAYYQPGASDGTRAGQYFVNTYDLSSRPLYEVVGLTLHEGVPGHHLQISFQQENQSLPQWRREYYFHAYGEGWGLYSEWLGQEMGVYTTPYERFGRLIYEVWRAVRLVVDTGMHAKGWARQEAIDYMMANTGLTKQNVVSEVDRYMTYPGQATSYKLGELKIKELRRRAEQALGDKFDLREFHVVVLEGGSLPLSALDAKIDRWIENQQ